MRLVNHPRRSNSGHRRQSDSTTMDTSRPNCCEIRSGRRELSMMRRRAAGEFAVSIRTPRGGVAVRPTRAQIFFEEHHRRLVKPSRCTRSLRRVATRDHGTGLATRSRIPDLHNAILPGENRDVSASPLPPEPFECRIPARHVQRVETSFIAHHQYRELRTHKPLELSSTSWHQHAQGR